MTLLTILLFLQETLPPPPTPTSSPDIDTSQVIGVVIISLALIMIGALAVRPLVARKLKPGEEPEEAGSTTPLKTDERPGPKSETGTRSILQFPKQTLAAATATDQSWVGSESEGSIEDRFRRVISDSGRRRKLGDRQPNVPPEVSPTRIRTLATESPAMATARPTAPLILSPIVPLNDRRGFTGKTAQRAVAVAAPDVAAPPVQQPAETAKSLDVELGRIERSSSHESTEPFVLVRKEEPTAEVHADPVETTINADAGLAPSNGPDWQAVIDELDLGNAAATQPASAIQPVLLHELKDSEADDRELNEVESGGIPPSQADLELVVVAEEIDSFEIVDSKDVEYPVLAGISQTVRDLIYCANAGKLINGFALYSDPYLFRFMDSTGLDEAGFRDRFTSMPSRPGHEWERLDTISDVVRQPDGRISGMVSYIDQDGRPTNGRERFRFEYSVEDSFWMIDDIQTIEPD